MEVIDQNLIFLDKDFSTQQELFSFLADEIVKAGRASEADKIVEGFYQREKEFSTALASCIAIPHCRIPSIHEASVVVVRNKRMIPWTEGEEVNLAFALLVPTSNENQIHIRILANVAQLIMEDEFVNAVYEAKDPKVIFEKMKVLNNKEETR